MKRNTWLEVDHYPEILVGQYVVPNFVSNSVSIKISEKEYIIYSPGKSLLDAWPLKNIDAITVHIIMPNAFHFLGVKAWMDYFPLAKLYASEIAIHQLKGKKEFSLIDKVIPIEKSNIPLPQDYQLMYPLGHRAGDIWLTKMCKNLSLWITCDSFLNYERLSNQPFARLMQKILGAAPGLKISQVIKWFILNDRKAFKNWALERARADRPNTLIPSHGEVFQSENVYLDIIQVLENRL